jgi:hypothetical protein
VNKKGQKLQCSQYMPLDIQTVDGRLPVVVYCHCNSGSKRDADEAVVHLLPAGISVVAFDFSVSVSHLNTDNGEGQRRRGRRGVQSRHPGMCASKWVWALVFFLHSRQASQQQQQQQQQQQCCLDSIAAPPQQHA